VCELAKHFEKDQTVHVPNQSRTRAALKDSTQKHEALEKLLLCFCNKAFVRRVSKVDESYDKLTKLVASCIYSQLDDDIIRVCELLVPCEFNLNFDPSLTCFLPQWGSVLRKRFGLPLCLLPRLRRPGLKSLQRRRVLLTEVCGRWLRMTRIG
jgi:hypothetical protein